MNRRRFGVLGASAFGLAMTGGLRSVRAEDDTLVLSFGGFTPSRHPWQTVSLIDYNLCDLIFDPLLTRNDQSVITKVLAEDYQYVDADRLRVTIKQGITFSDGTPLTIDDVKHSLDQTSEQGTTGSASMYRRWMDRTELVDDKTIDVISKEPYRLIPETMASTSFILPAHASQLENYANPIGCGPYRLVEQLPNDRIVYERRDDYWGEKPRFAQIIVRQIPESSTRVAALAAGEVDYVDNLPVDDIENTEKAGKKVISVPSDRMMYLAFNATSDLPVRDAKVRKAIFHAIDREGINQAIYAGRARVLDGPLSPGVAFRAEGLVEYDYNPEKAKALLAEAGYADGFELGVTGSTDRYPGDKDVVEIVGAMLEQIGIKVNLMRYDFATMRREVFDDRDAKGGKYGLTLAAWSNTFLDPDSGFIMLDPNYASNYGGYDNTRLNEIMAAGRGETDQAKLAAMYKEAQEIVWDTDPAMVPLWNLPRIAGVSDKLSDMTLRADERQVWAWV